MQMNPQNMHCLDTEYYNATCFLTFFIYLFYLFFRLL